MNQAERELMQRVLALPIGRELRIPYADLWRATAGDDALPSPEQVRAFVGKVSRSWGVSVIKDPAWHCYTLVRLHHGKR